MSEQVSSLKVAVLGGGSFGTAIANILSANQHNVFLWMRDDALAAEINSIHENKNYLEGFSLNKNLYATVDLQEAVQDADLVFMSVPSSSCREVAAKLKQLISPNTFLISTTKGIEANSFSLMSQVLAQECPQQTIGVISGPNLATEIASGQLTGTVVASDSAELIAKVQQVLCSASFRVYSSNDMYGVELAGALKNIYAIMSGMASALEVGYNTSSMLITRSLAEMSRFAVALGANPMTFLGLAGVGDLIVTCTSDLSRNFRVGYRLGKGEDLKAIIDDLGQVAEGINTLRLVTQKASELNIYMPLATAMYQVIFEGKTISEVVEALMLGENNLDVEFTVT